MQLKRYVLTEDNKIYCKNDLKRSADGTDWLVEVGYQNHNVIGKIIKTSDNILDLVEVDDLIEIPQTIIRVDKVYDNGAFETLVSREYSKVIAIYKRQPNGDYKRYEVK